jgi:hypothetical protein
MQNIPGSTLALLAQFAMRSFRSIVSKYQVWQTDRLFMEIQFWGD